jgi:AraC-like DNA-binding protein
MARPKSLIDPEQVEKLAAMFCTMEEIAQVVGCSKRTLERRFVAVIEKGRARGKMSLKRKQFEVAQGGNVTMLIWLGKQHLEQRDKVEKPIDDRKPLTLSYSAPEKPKGGEG